MLDVGCPDRSQSDSLPETRFQSRDEGLWVCGSKNLLKIWNVLSSLPVFLFSFTELFVWQPQHHGFMTPPPRRPKIPICLSIADNMHLRNAWMTASRKGNFGNRLHRRFGRVGTGKRQFLLQHRNTSPSGKRTSVLLSRLRHLTGQELE